MKNYIKTLVIASSLFIGYNTKAQEVPKALKDAVITVTLTNGKVYTFSANEWMVVRRKKASEIAKIADDKKKAEDSDKKDSDKEVKRNRIAVHGGVGLLGLESSSNGSVVTIQEKTVPVFGISLSRLLTDKYSVTGTILSNRTFTLGLGLDFND